MNKIIILLKKFAHKPWLLLLDIFPYLSNLHNGEGAESQICPESTSLKVSKHLCQMQLIDNFTLKLAASSINLKNSLQKLYNEKNSKVELYSSLLQSLDTNNVLKRGFAIIRQEDKVISRKSQLNINKSVEINMHDGIVKIN